MAEDDIRAPIRVPPERDQKTGRFLTGNIGGGRHKGSRPKLSAMFWNDLYAVWKAKGMSVLERLADDDPAAFAKIAAMLVLKVEDSNTDSEARDAAVERFIEERRQKALKIIAKMDEADDA
jgi:hypothetical protein